MGVLDLRHFRTTERPRSRLQRSACRLATDGSARTWPWSRTSQGAGSWVAVKEFLCLSYQKHGCIYIYIYILNSIYIYTISV